MERTNIAQYAKDNVNLCIENDFVDDSLYKKYGGNVASYIIFCKMYGE